MTPGVAKIPDPMTLDMIKKYADDQLIFRPTDDASGMVLNSVLGVFGVRSGVSNGVLGSSRPYGNSRAPFVWATSMFKNRTGPNMPPGLPLVGVLEAVSNGSDDSTSDVLEYAENESPSEALDDRKGKEKDGTICSKMLSSAGDTATSEHAHEQIYQTREDG